MAQGVRAARRRQGLVFALTVVGVLLALTNTNAQTELVHRRSASCDGTLPLPTSVYFVGFEIFAVITAFQEARPIEALCFG